MCFGLVQLGSTDQKLKRLDARWQGYFLFVSLIIFLSAMTRVKQSGQANRTLPVGVRDNGRIVAASTRRLHSGHRLIFEGSLPIKPKLAINTVTRQAHLARSPDAGFPCSYYHYARLRQGRWLANSRQREGLLPATDG